MRVVRGWAPGVLAFVFGLGVAASIGAGLQYRRTKSMASWTSTDLGCFGGERRLCWGTVKLDPYADGLFWCDDTVRRVLTMRELRRKVRIGREAEALRFARLVTPSSAERGGYLLTGARAELIPTSMNQGPPPSRPGEYGVLPDGLYDRAGLAPPHVRRGASDFLVIRWIQEADTGTRKVVERIGMDGSYRRVYLPDVPAEHVPTGVVGLR